MLSSCNKSVATCEQEIKSRLGEPSSYERITYLKISDAEYRIEYIADDANGASIQAEGLCTLSEDGTEAEWLDLRN